jgi:hypothetical protein
MKNQESKSKIQKEQIKFWLENPLEEPNNVELLKASDENRDSFIKMMAVNGKLPSVSPTSEPMYDPQSETGARHWYYLNHMRIEHKTVAQTAPGADFIIGGRVKK